MTRAAWVIGVVVVSLASAGVRAGPSPVPTPAPTAVSLTEVVRPEFRDAVARCLRQPTLTAQARGSEVVCTVAVYEWLFEHPDRVALAWRRLNVPAITIRALGDGRFAWGDEHGSEVIWQTVGTFADGRVWYGSGKVRPGTLGPLVPVQGVVVVRYPRKVERDGVALFAPTIQAYMHSDSRVAHAVLKTLGPLAPRLAEDAAEQLLEFFNGIADYVQRNPRRANELLGPER